MRDYALDRKAGGREQGVGLIEVMVALVVLSLGFLVSANMQLRGMRANQDSYHQSQALMLANEMMDRMRNNREGVLAGRYDNKSTGTLTRPSCAASGCDEEGMALLDLYEWSASLVNLRNESSFIPMLPYNAAGEAASGTISAPAANGSYTITINWTRQTRDGEVAETLPVRFIP